MDTHAHQTEVSSDDNNDDDPWDQEDKPAIPCPQAIELMFPPGAKKRISLKAQKPRVQDLLTVVIGFVPCYLVSTNGFPD